MRLTELQTVEVSKYVAAATQYRETYHEIYDHVMNEMADLALPYDIELVGKIVRQHFGSFKEIKKHEHRYLTRTKYSYFKLLALEITGLFRITNIAYTILVLVLGGLAHQFATKNAYSLTSVYLWLMGFSFVLVSVWLFNNRYILFNLREKLTMKGEIIGWLLLFPFSLAPMLFTVFLAEHNLFGLSIQVKNLITISFFLLVISYARSFIILYRKRLKVF